MKETRPHEDRTPGSSAHPWGNRFLTSVGL